MPNTIRKRAGLGLLGVSLLVGAVFVAGAVPQVALKIAVVDISEVFNKHPRTDALEAKIRKNMDRYEEEYKEVLERISRLKEEQQETDEGTLFWRERDREIAVLKEETKIRNKMAEADLSKQAFDASKELLDEIEGKIERYCRQKGITICFKIDTIPLRGSEMSKMELAFRSVLYYDKAIDITSDIVEILKK